MSSRGIVKKIENPAMLTDKFKLTEAGEKLLEVMVNPETRTWTVTKICETAGISRDSFYRLFNRDPQFVEAYTQMCQTACLSHALSAINALAQEAKTGDVQAAKAVLEMAGIRNPSATLNLNHQAGATPTLKDIIAKRNKTNN